MDKLGLVEAIDRFREGIVVTIANTANRGLNTCFRQALGIFDRGVLGGFNRSSQHFSKGGCDEEIQAFGSVCASGFAIARPASRGTARELQTVLDGDCLGALERGCCG